MDVTAHRADLDQTVFGESGQTNGLRCAHVVDRSGENVHEGQPATVAKRVQFHRDLSDTLCIS